MPDPMILAADLGATKTNLALISPDDDMLQLHAESSFACQEYPSLEAILDVYRGQHDDPLAAAIFGVAGPVLDGRAKITNLPWVIEESKLAANLGIDRVHLLNDLEATATAIPILPQSDLFTLNERPSREGGNLAVLAPGTGLGEAFMIWQDGRFHAFPTEGGHSAFAPQNQLEFELQQYLMEEKGFDHVSYENVASGMGISHIYEFLKTRGYGEEPPALLEQLAAAEDPTPLIVNAALSDDGCDICNRSLEIFIDALAVEAGNFALKTFATGGVYLGGGMPPRILSRLTPERFLPVFTRKGPMSDLLASMPVKVILNPKAGLLGAAWFGKLTLG